MYCIKTFYEQIFREWVAYKIESDHKTFSRYKFDQSHTFKNDHKLCVGLFVYSTCQV